MAIGEQDGRRQRAADGPAGKVGQSHPVRTQGAGDEPLLPLPSAARHHLRETEPRGQRLHDLEVGLHLGRRGHHGPDLAQVVVAVSADHVVVLEQGRGGQHHRGQPGGVGQERVHHHGQLAGPDRLRHGLGLGQHGHRVAGGDPQRADRRVARGQHLRAEQGLAHRSRRGAEALHEAEVESGPTLVVEGDAAAGDAEIARDGAERIERAHDGPAHTAAAHAPADQDRGGLARSEPGGQILGVGHRDVGALTPAGDRLALGQGAQIVEPVAIPGCLRVDPAPGPQQPRHRHGQREVTARARLDEPLTQTGGAVVHGIDQHQPGARRPRLAQHRQGVRAGDVDVFPPQNDVPGVQQIVQVVRVLEPEVDGLGGVPGPGADVTALHRDRPETLEEVVVEVLEQPERAARAVVKDGRRTRLPADRFEPLGHEIERLVPARPRSARRPCAEAVS